MKIAAMSLTATLALAGCARDPAAVPIGTAADVVLDPAKSYAVVSLNGPDVVVGQYALCRPDANGRIEYEGYQGFVDCGSESVRIGLQEDRYLFNDADARTRLSDGSLVRIMEFRDLEEPDRYLLAARAVGEKVETLDGEDSQPVESKTLKGLIAIRSKLRVIDIKAGGIHYLGHVEGEEPIRWRDPGRLVQLLPAAFPNVKPDRFNFDTPETITRLCFFVPALGCTIEKWE